MPALLTPTTEYAYSGSGGGSGKGGAGSRPQETPNSLRSSSRAQVLYAMAAGEIEGLGAEPLKRIYLDNQPIQNADGTFNFKDVTIDYRTGTNFQTPIAGFTDIASEFGVGVKLSSVTGTINRTLSDANADAVVVRLSVNSLQRYDDKEGAVGTRVDFSIGLSVDGGPTYNVLNDAFDGKSSGPYEQSYRIPLYKPGTNYKISVTRLTPDSNSSKVQDELVWQSYTSIVNASIAYVNTATLAIGLNAEQFNNIPPVGLDLSGWICDVPDNYDPVTRTYTGIWSGNFKRAYTNNPAWLFYYLVKDDINGCGRQVDASLLDKAAFYQIGQYCDEIVPDGFGGYEPRFVCNAYIESADDAYNVLNTLASTFRGMVYWANGLITATQDAPTNYTRFYGEENTLQEVDDQGQITTPNFNYAGTGSKARHTVVLVTYLDKYDFHKQKVEVVQDLPAIARYGYHETTVTAFGCDSRGQAARVGKWLLYTENNETEVINFGTPSDGMLCRPGEVIRTIDPTRSGRRQTGRIVDIVGDDATLDVLYSALNVSAASQNNFSVIDPATAKQYTYGVVSITANPVGYAVVRVLGGWGAIPSAPLINTPWMIQTPDLVGESWRVFGVSETDKHQYSVTATKHNPSKYNAIERGLTLDVIPTSVVGDITKPPKPPTTLLFAESLYESRAAGLRIRLDVAWTRSPTSQVDRYNIEYQRVDINNGLGYVVLPPTRTTFVKLDDFLPGRYAFRVQAVNRLGLRSEYTESLIEVYGLTKPPTAVTNFTGVVVDQYLQLRWDESPDLDVRAGGQFLLRFTPKVSSVSWSDGFELDYVSGAATSTTVFYEYGTYMIKSVDSTKNQSNNFTAFVSDSTPRTSRNNIITIVEDSLFTGTRNNVVVSNGTLQLAPNTFIDGLSGLWDSLLGNFDSLTPGNFDALTGLIDSLSGLWDGDTASESVTSGNYLFANQINLGAVFSGRLTATLSASNTNTNVFFDSLSGSVDALAGTWDQSTPERANVVIEIRRSLDGINFGAWQRFTPGDYRGHAFMFRAILSSTSAISNVLIDRLRVTLDMPDRSEQGRATGSNVVTFESAFRAPPLVTSTIVNADAGDYIRVESVTASAFTAVVYNLQGQSISKQFDWVARGYGTRFN
jgi:predicted phage tail protein